jgi:hypothetical protein
VLLGLLVAILLHASFFAIRFPRVPPTAPPRVELQQIDPSKLEAIRKNWQKESKGLLLDRDPSRPSEKEAPPDARYQSDRNIRVEKETRAANPALVPKPGAATVPKADSKSQPPRRKALPKLGSLGVPLPIPRKPEESGESGNPGTQGGSQAILDPNVPLGGETLLNAEDMALWEAAQEKVGGPERGRAKRTIIAALQALGSRKRPSKAELIQLLESRLTD